MQPETFQTSSPSDPTIRRLVIAAIGIIALICAALILLTVKGYGTVTFALPTGANLKINGHTVSAKTLKMRSGTYKTTITTPQYQPYQGTLTVSNFKHTTYQPSLATRSVTALVSSVIGAYGTYGVPAVSNTKWYDGNTWLAGVLGPGSAQTFALHFTDGNWQVAYAQGSTGYPSDLSKLPPAIHTYLAGWEAYYAAN